MPSKSQVEHAGAKDPPPNAVGRTFTRAIFGNVKDVTETRTAASNSETGDSDSNDEDDDEDDDAIFTIRRKYGSPGSASGAGGSSGTSRRIMTREGVKSKAMEDLKRSLRERAKQRKFNHRLNSQK